MNLKQEYDIDNLIALQKQMRHEDVKDNDCQASPRFWVIMDYREVIGNVDYDDGREVLVYNDGDNVQFETFEDLKEFLLEGYLEGEEVPQELQAIFDSERPSLDDLSAYVLEHMNECGHYDELFLKVEEYIVPDTLFLTKEAAKAHLKGNKHHYTSKAHTYAMTAWRSPGMFDVYRFLHQFDFNALKEKQDIDKMIEEVMKKAAKAGFLTFMNHNMEVILDMKHNVYFGTKDASTLRDIKRKVLVSLSRYCVKGVKPKRQDRYLALLNDILGTDLDKDDMELVYRFTGNGIDRELADKFIESGYDMELLREHRRNVDASPPQEELTTS